MGCYGFVLILTYWNWPFDSNADKKIYLHNSAYGRPPNHHKVGEKYHIYLYTLSISRNKSSAIQYFTHIIVKLKQYYNKIYCNLGNFFLCIFNCWCSKSAPKLLDFFGTPPPWIFFFYKMMEYHTERLVGWF